MRIPRVCSLLLLVACAHGGAPEVTPAADASAPRVDGAPTPREAVLVFLTAAGSRDERTLASVWGSTAGPARTRYAAKELHGYAVSLACVFANDSAHVLAERDSADGSHIVRVELFRGQAPVQTTLLAVRGPADRWYVSRAEDAPVAGSCR